MKKTLRLKKIVLFCRETETEEKDEEEEEEYGSIISIVRLQRIAESLFS